MELKISENISGKKMPVANTTGIKASTLTVAYFTSNSIFIKTAG